HVDGHAADDVAARNRARRRAHRDGHERAQDRRADARQCGSRRGWSVRRRAASWRPRRAGGPAGSDQRRVAHPRRRADQREREEVRLRRSPRAARRGRGARVARGARARAAAPRSRTMDRRGLSSDRPSCDDLRGAAGGRRTRMSWPLRTDPSGFATRWSDDAAASYRATDYWRDETLADVARRTYREAPDRLLLIEGDRRLTRAEAWDAAARL